MLECKTEKRNSHQCEHGQPMKQTRSLFCTCDFGMLAVNHNISVTSMADKYCMGKRAWQLSIKLCHSWGYEQFYLSFATGRIACDYYARECEFGILKKQNKTKQKNKQEKSFGCVLTKWGVPLNSSVVWELITEGERPFHCGKVRLQKFKDSLKACFEK